MKKILQKKSLITKIFWKRNKIKKIEIDSTYPEYIIQNKNKYSDWII